MKVHKILLLAVADVVADIFDNGKMADKAIQSALKSNRKWGSRDRAFVASYAYDMVRWWRKLHVINGSDIKDTRKDTLLRLLGIQMRLNGIDLPEMDAFRGLSRKSIDAGLAAAETDRRARESVPDWLDERCFNELGSRWEVLIKALNEDAPVGLRVNTSKTNRSELMAALEKEGVPVIEVPQIPTALYLKERKNVFTTAAFKQGWFEVQDPGSQLIASYLQVQPGMRVVDACAGGGGKSLHLAALMESKGQLISLDIYEWKLKELKRRARRNGLSNIETRWIENNKVIKRLHESADRLLLDVPCSGLGVLRRNPDAKWKLNAEFLDRVRATQQELLQNYSTMLKKGGLMVYATCSILPSENENQIKTFLKTNPHFRLISEKWTQPETDGFDGFYMALMEKN